MIILALAGALLSGTPVSVAKSKHRPGSVSVQLYNLNTISTSYTIEVKVFDNVTGTVYFDNQVTLSPNQGALEGPVSLTDANPSISVKWTQSTSSASNFYLTQPSGVDGCHHYATNSNTFTLNVNTGGYGTYEFDFNPGAGCI